MEKVMGRRRKIIQHPAENLYNVVCYFNYY